MRNLKENYTPLVHVDGIFAKLECVNPTGSIKDRIVDYILNEDIKKGKLRPGMHIVEASSGNTGIALAAKGEELGYRTVIVMPKDMSSERKELIEDLGARLVLCSEGDFAEAAEIRDELISINPSRYYTTNQFSNDLNTQCHYQTTGQEIIQQMARTGRFPIDSFVAGVGTGGTLIGTALALKEIYPNIHIVAVEPKESAVMSGKNPGLHKIPGIGDGFIPQIAQGNRNGLHNLIDEVITISSKDAIDAAKYLSNNQNYCVGISSGANYLAAIELSQQFETVVTIFPDGYVKYQSLGLKKCKGCKYDKK